MLCLSYHNFLNNTRWKHWSIKVQGQSFYDIWRLKSYIKIFYSWPHNFQCKKIFILTKNCRIFHFHFLENKIFICYIPVISTGINLWKFCVFIVKNWNWNLEGHQQWMLDRLMKVLPDTTRNYHMMSHPNLRLMNSKYI